MRIHSSKLFKLINEYNLHFLSRFFTVTDGLLPDEEDNDQYIFGAEKVEKRVLVDDGNWIPYLPDDEVQKGKYVETMGCTGYALLNCVEMIAKRKWGYEWNKSDRFTNKMSGTGHNGNSMRAVIDSVREKHGCVSESSWPWDINTFTWNKYYSEIDNQIKLLGTKFFKEYTLGFERVPMNKQLIQQALKYGPLYVSLYAWYYINGLYRSYYNANHASTVVRALNDNYSCYDSYSPFIKSLAPDFNFGSIYLILLEKKEKEFNKTEILALMKRGFKFIMRTDKINGGVGQIYELKDGKLIELNEKEKKDWAVRALADRKDLTGISEKDYYSLLR